MTSFEQDLREASPGAQAGWVILATCISAVSIGIYPIGGVLVTGSLLRTTWNALYGD